MAKNEDQEKEPKYYHEEAGYRRKEWGSRKKTDYETAARIIYQQDKANIDRGIILEASKEEGRFMADFNTEEAFVDKFLQKARILSEKAKERGANPPTASQVAKAVQRTQTFKEYADQARENFVAGAAKLDKENFEEMKKILGVRGKRDLVYRTDKQGNRMMRYDKASGNYLFKDENGNLWTMKIEEYKKKDKGNKLISSKHFVVTSATSEETKNWNNLEND